MDTESVNQNTRYISDADTEEILRMINQEDAKVADMVAECIPEIGMLVERGYETLKKGGKIVYCGAGTSGRLAVADAAECPPTFGVSADTVMAVISGGEGAVIRAAEGCEDSQEKGIEAFLKAGCTENDLIIGISASGKAPFVRAFMKEAKKHGCKVGALTNNKNTPMEEIADIVVAVLTGPEVIKGSTRMKAGTAQKMVLNMFSTALFIRMGYVYGNYMVNMQVSNRKLQKRAIEMVKDIAEIDKDEATRLLIENEWSVRNALAHFSERKGE